MIKKILIIGMGNISSKHYLILKKINKKLNILRISSRKFSKYNNKNLQIIINFDPDYIIVASPSSEHFLFLKKLELLFTNKVILIEKPLFNKKEKLPRILNNKYFVGYNLRFNPVIGFIKKFISNKKIFFVNIFCSSYLPSWRKNKVYQKSVSASKNLGGGVLLELSHEIDYLIWMLGKINLKNSISEKISNLKINTDDLFLFHGTYKKTFINMSLNFFSKIKKREIIIEGSNFSILGDLINNKVYFFDKKKISKKLYEKLPYVNTLRLQHLAILNNKYDNLCTINDGNKILDFVTSVKENQ